MSNKKSHDEPMRERITPLIGSLLRLPREHVVARMLAEVNRQGFDVSEAELGIFMYPGPDGRRPSELAKQCNTSRQAMNYQLAGLERRAYIARDAGTAPNATVVRMTQKGWDMVVVMRDCVATVEREWVAHLGEERFNALRDALYDLSTWLGKVR
jgi:DNA-binding MarR family transcriptional regulator